MPALRQATPDSTNHRQWHGEQPDQCPAPVLTATQEQGCDQGRADVGKGHQRPCVAEDKGAKPAVPDGPVVCHRGGHGPVTGMDGVAHVSEDHVEGDLGSEEHSQQRGQPPPPAAEGDRHESSARRRPDRGRRFGAHARGKRVPQPGERAGHRAHDGTAYPTHGTHARSHRRVRVDSTVAQGDRRQGLAHPVMLAIT
jgi:hypothetical protein